MIDEDEDAYVASDERHCPVCEGSTLYPTFGAMMDHWKRIHPNRAPGRGSTGVSGGGSGVPAYIDEIIKRPIDNEDEVSLDTWATDMESHPYQALELWQALGFV